MKVSESSPPAVDPVSPASRFSSSPTPTAAVDLCLCSPVVSASCATCTSNPHRLPSRVSSMRWKDDTSRTVWQWEWEWDWEWDWEWEREGEEKGEGEGADRTDSRSASHERSNERLLGSDRADRSRGSGVEGDGGLGTGTDNTAGECRGGGLSRGRMGRGSTKEEDTANEELMETVETS